jgi:dipeptidyl aminopeptidase/acylaminoacyl peptidase
MRKLVFLLTLCLPVFFVRAQKKKPLDPSVYDGWQSIGERMFSPDGKWLVYTVVAQEGDGRLVVRSTSGSYAKEIPRGAEAAITADSRFVVFRIKPFFAATREARIRKKKPEEMPKDSLGWMELGTDRMTTIARVKSYALPEKNGQWLAYLMEKPEPAKGDSAKSKGKDSTRVGTAAGANLGAAPKGKDSTEGTDLVLRDLHASAERRFPLTGKYSFSPLGNTLVVEMTRRSADSLSKAAILWVNTGSGKMDTVLRGFSDTRNFALDETGEQLAFVAERDSVPKALVKFYKLWYYRPGMDSAKLRADRSSIGAALAASPNKGDAIPTERLGFTVSPDYANHFSKDGKRLFIGLAPVRPPKDTTLADFETARLDIWNYSDDYLQPQQLVQLNSDLKRAYSCVLPRDGDQLIPLADANCETVVPGKEGNGRWALGTSTRGYRVENQWEGNGLRHVYVVDMNDGSRKPVRDGVRGSVYISPGGNYLLWYDWKDRNWYTYSIAGGTTANVTRGIPVPLYDEEDDHPDDAPPHGYMGWLKDDAKVYVYDKYDIWQCDPTGKTTPLNLTRGIGRRQELSIRYVPLDPEEKPGQAERPGEEPLVHEGQWLLLTLFNQRDMGSGQVFYRLGTPFTIDTTKNNSFALSYNGFFKAKERRIYGYLQGSFDKPYDIFVKDSTKTAGRQLSAINPQQADYNWLTAELHHFQMLDGKRSEGLLYKPEDFDSTKKYPILFYFYERDARTRYDYINPQPVRASINVAYFVSNGYLVFDPDIFYKTGQPGEDAYNSVMAAAKYMSQFKWVDTTKMGLQGHSWGGYQVAYLVTRTPLFAAAEAGAPVANMTSAYGGIRWESGISRQFQYEHSQSRLGASLWEKPELYIRNSPLFNADKVTTPLLMMANDADGAVPWYQGIEYFSALRRLGKKVWMMEYNGEGHGLTERRDRKDWSMRLSQFFDYYLKGAHAPRWMTEGVPATMKGIDWGLGTD